MRASVVQAVTFDVGGTLLKVWPSVGHIYGEVAAEHGVDGLVADVLNARFAATWKNSKGFRHSRGDWARLVDATFQGLTAVRPSRSFFDELWDRFSYPEAWHVFEDVVPTLEGLAARGIRLAVISNWDERLRLLLQRLKLARHFEVLTVSREVGAAKPARAIFRHAARSLGLPPSAILHVGDDWEADVRGARAAGFAARWLDRRDGKGRRQHIASLLELATCLRVEAA